MFLVIGPTTTALVSHYAAPDRRMAGAADRGCIPWDAAPSYLVRDNDGAYGQTFKDRVRAMGIRDRPISPRSPWQNPYVERLIGTLRRDCLDHVLIFSERRLRRVQASYSVYYNETRTHLALGNDAPLGRAVERFGAVVAIPVLSLLKSPKHRQRLEISRGRPYHGRCAIQCKAAADSEAINAATADDIRRFQLHLAEPDLSICNRNRIMTGVRFLVRVTLRRLDLTTEIFTCASRRRSLAIVTLRNDTRQSQPIRLAHAAAVTSRQVCITGRSEGRSVLAEVRWRWTLKVL